MSGLADELLADLDGLSDNDEDYQDEEPGAELSTVVSQANARKRKASDSDDEAEDEEAKRDGKEVVGGLVLEGGIRPADELDVEDVQQMELGGIDDVRKVATLEGSRRMAETLKVRVLRICSFIFSFSRRR
jgi:U4/U6 small nuclear ribonucleoprotein PRP31